MRKANFYAGVFLVSLAALMLQIVQTRILSVVVWYHLAFFVISLAMFGLTAGAVWVYLQGERFTAKTLTYDLGYFSGLFAFATAVGLCVQMTLAPVITRVATTLWVWAELAVCLALPFVFAGIVISLALTRSPYPVARVYGMDLAGASIGAIGALLLLQLTDGPSTVLWVAVCAAASSIVFTASGTGDEPEKKPLFHTWFWRRRRWIFLALLAAALINPHLEHGLQPIAVKGKFEFPGTHALRRWNSFSRVDVSPVFVGAPVMWGPSPRVFDQPRQIAQVDLLIDGDAGTTAYRFDGNYNAVEFLKYDVTNLAYFLPGRERAAVIGVGGGRDVLSAALFGLKEITAVELNPILVDLQTQSDGLLPFTNLAAIPGVRFVADEGRSWLARSHELFDVIQMSLVDTWAATGAGAFTLSENGLYTVEAWKIFISRLTPKGVLTVSRWYDPGQPDETGRMVSLAAATLMELGVADPSAHLFLAAQKHIATLVLSKSPLAPADVEALEQAAAFYQHEVLITPRRQPGSTVLARIINARDRRSLAAFTSSLDFDLTPPTDERPFFFNQLPLSKPLHALSLASSALASSSQGGGVRRGNLVATLTLLVLFTIALVFALAVLIIPLRGAVRQVGSRLVAYGTLYFFLIGIGFMLIEIGLLQRLSIFLGHPVYSLSVLLFTLILSAGVGSLLSEKLPLQSRARLVCWGFTTGIYASMLPVFLPLLFAAYSAAGLSVRVVLCAAIIAPAGIALGFGFPTGMRLVTAIDVKPTPWFWGINGAAGVLASIAAVALSLAFGIGATLMLGGLCYLLLIPVALALLRVEKLVSIRPAVKPRGVVRQAKSPVRSR